MNTEQRYQVIKYGPNNEPVIRDIDGEPVVLKGFEEYQFFVHPAISWNSRWVVSEAATGRFFGEQYETKDQAIAGAQERLAEVGKDHFRAMIEGFIAQTGVLNNAVLPPLGLHSCPLCGHEHESMGK